VLSPCFADNEQQVLYESLVLLQWVDDYYKVGWIGSEAGLAG